jgi:putative ABC transport system substrate-binding protein
MFAKPLAGHGFVEGKNLRFETRVVTERGPAQEALAADLLRARPEVVIAFGASNIEALAGLTRTIPIVCGGTADPVGAGYAKTLRRPGGNITGLSLGLPEMSDIIIGTVRAVKPAVKRIGSIVRGGARAAEGWSRIVRSLELAASAAGVGFDYHPAETLAEIEAVLDRFDPGGDVACFINAPGEALYAAAASACIRRRLASFTSLAPLAREGVLMHYTINHDQPVAKVAAIVAALLRGASAAETPFALPDRTLFIVNRATAKAIGLQLPAEILTRATEVIG